MKGWYAVLPALLFLLFRSATAAENPEEAVRELARRIAAFAGSREAVTLGFRTAAAIPATEMSRARRLVESALRDSNTRLDPSGTVEIRVTLSESPGRRLLVGEARRGEERQTWIVSWPAERVAAANPSTAIRLDRKQLWEQSEPVLDATLAGDSLLVLSVSKLTLFLRQAGAWQESQSTPVAIPRIWPRDPRGRMILNGPALRLFLPGAVCSGSWQPALAVECKAGDEPWPVESGGRYLLLAGYAATRNHFDGRITTQSGERKSVGPFYSAAAVEEAGEVSWVLAGMDGRAVLMDRRFTPGVVVGNWGSDIAGAGMRCGAAMPLLATRPGDEGEAVQAWAIVNRQAEALSPPLQMPGPVTALWPAAEGAVAVVRDPVTEKYAAYLVTISCGQ